ncbi:MULTISPECIES: LuxR C-terminal-related transcriptional regulator [unclassified Mycolicibacterium]|uniref:LuxR C-terminal-related transcriptional regulator n=2 Tax=Mycolicibacterium TaxID=1866885 RepID=UPI0012DFE38C|nr:MULTISPECIES: LuxR C-terminal-related transcriptional regulator [unclassified Mycolicibacterium]
MGFIEAALSASDVSGILMCGSAGVGKSRIAREALATAAAHGYECRWVVGTSSAQSVPLGAFTAWATSGTTDTIRLLREVIESITSAPSLAPVVVGVDDVHLLDELSLFVVHQVVQRGSAKVILTVRGEPNLAALQEILKLGQFDRLDLQPLTAEETSTLLSTVLCGPIDPQAAQRLWTLTQGNALYLRNIVEQEIADGRLVRQHGSWQWTGDPVMPPGLVELIESRIGALPASVGTVVDALAVGEPIELAALQRITEQSAVEDADTRGLITLEPVAGGMEVRVAHPLYGEVRRRRAPATRLRRLRGLVAIELAAADDRDDIRVVVRRAALSLDSDLTPDPDLFVKAAHGAVWLADLPLADRLAEAAIRAGAGPEPSLVRAHALSWLGHGEQAEEILARIDPDSLPEPERARLAFLRASNLMWALGSPAEARRLVDEASSAFSPQARIYTDAFLAVHAFATDDPQTATRHLEHLSPEQLPPIVGAEIAWVVTAVSADAGHTSAAVASAETGYSVADRSFDAPQMRFNIADAHVSALLLSGHIHESVALAGRVREQAASLPGTAQLLGAAVAGRTALGAGNLPTACALLEQATSGLSSAGYLTGWAYRYEVTQATALAMRGATDEAVAHLAALDERPRRFRLLDYERAIARAWIAAGQGAVSEAISLSLAAAEQACGKGQFAAEVLCRQTAAQFGDRSGATRLRELEPLVEGPRVSLAARLADGLHRSDAAELSDLSVEFENIGDLVTAIDSAAHASLVYRVQGLRGSSLKCSTRATDLAERCGVSTPALRTAAETLPLTNREREIVMLIAEGLSNQAIAARLTLSVRTVESHIYRAMLKTETTSREDIASLLRHKKHS